MKSYAVLPSFDSVTCSLYTVIYLVILPLNYIVRFGDQEAASFYPQDLDSCLIHSRCSINVSQVDDRLPYDRKKLNSLRQVLPIFCLIDVMKGIILKKSGNEYCDLLTMCNQVQAKLL